MQPRLGPTITNNVILNTGDDNIAVHGAYQMVARILPRNKTVTIGYWSCGDPSCLPFVVNDTMLMYSAAVRNLGTAIISSITATSNPGLSGISPNAPAVSLLNP